MTASLDIIDFLDFTPGALVDMEADVSDLPALKLNFVEQIKVNDFGVDGVYISGDFLKLFQGCTGTASVVKKHRQSLLISPMVCTSFVALVHRGVADFFVHGIKLVRTFFTPTDAVFQGRKGFFGQGHQVTS